MQRDPKVMSGKDWVVAQSKDHAIKEIKYLFNSIKLKGCKVSS